MINSFGFLSRKEIYFNFCHFPLEQIIVFMEKEKPYLNPKFSTQELSRMMDIRLYQCSYLTNYVIGKSFREWINEYRIDHFIQEYPTIQTIFLESGFKNKNTFYTSFKKRWVFCRLNILQKNNGPHRLITNIIY